LRATQGAFAAQEELVVNLNTSSTRDTWLVHLRIAKALEILAPALAAENVPWMVVKGAALAHLLYSDPADRPLADLDVRIRPEDYQRARQALARASATLTYEAPSYGNLVADVRGQMVDLETTLSARFVTRLSVADVLSRSRELSLYGGIRVRVPDTVDHALILAANLVKDKITQAAPWSYRDTRVIADQPDFDAAVFVARAFDARMPTIARIVAETFDAESAGWRAVNQRLGPGPRRRTIRAYRWLSETHPTSLAARLMGRLVTDDAGDRARALAIAGYWELVHGRKRWGRRP
jgi:hypothetical protein